MTKKVIKTMQNHKTLYIFWGKVVGGAKRGKLLGFPTANIRLHKKIPEGIYASTVTIHSLGTRTSPQSSYTPVKQASSITSFVRTKRGGSFPLLLGEGQGKVWVYPAA